MKIVITEIKNIAGDVRMKTDNANAAAINKETTHLNFTKCSLLSFNIPSRCI